MVEAMTYFSLTTKPKSSKVSVTLDVHQLSTIGCTTDLLTLMVKR